MDVSIIAACMPSLHNLLAGFGSGLNDLQLPEEMELSNTTRSKGYGKGTRNDSKNSSSHSGSRSMFSSKNRGVYGSNVDTITTVSHFGPYGGNGRVRRAESAESTESTRHLTRQAVQQEQNGVMKTTEFWVGVEQDHEETGRGL